MKTPKASQPPPLGARPTEARVAVLSFPEDDDIPDRKTIAYFFRATRH